MRIVFIVNGFTKVKAFLCTLVDTYTHVHVIYKTYIPIWHMCVFETSNIPLDKKRGGEEKSICKICTNPEIGYFNFHTF